MLDEWREDGRAYRCDIVWEGGFQVFKAQRFNVKGGLSGSVVVGVKWSFLVRIDHVEFIALYGRLW